MLLVFHISVALLSLLLSAYTFFSPSWSKLHLSYVFVVLTLITGTVLVITAPAHLPQTCIEGLAYIGIVTYGIISTRQKLAKENAE